MLNMIKRLISNVYNLKAALVSTKAVNIKKCLAICVTLTLALATGLAWTGKSLLSQREESKPSRTISAGGDPLARPDHSRTGRDLASRGGIARDDIYLMARVIEGEAANEPFEGKVAVGAVIINRIENDQFPDSVRQVVYQPLAFEAIANGQYTRPVSKESLKAAQQAAGGSDPTGGAVYYWNPAKAKSQWIWQRPVTHSIGRHVFAI